MLPHETEIYTHSRGPYALSTDRARLNVDYILKFMTEESYWARNITREILQRSIDGSIAFGIYKDNEQVGFARVVTDCVVFA